MGRVGLGRRGCSSKDSGRGSGRRSGKSSCSGSGSCRGSCSGTAKEDEVWVWITGRSRVDIEGVGKRRSSREGVVDVGKGRCRGMLGRMGWYIEVGRMG